MSTLDIVEQRLAHLEITLVQHAPYQWAATCKIDQVTFSGSGFTPGGATDSLYSYMIRYFDHQVADTVR